MVRIVSASKDFETPSEGAHLAVLADIILKKDVPSPFGGNKDRLIFKWLLADMEADGKHRLSVIQSVNESLHEKSSLRKMIRSITGRDPGQSFDVDQLIGAQAQLIIQHNERDGRTFANVAAILKPPKGSPPVTIPADFKRSEREEPLAEEPPLPDEPTFEDEQGT